MEPEHTPDGFSAARRRVRRKKSADPVVLVLGAVVPGLIIGLIVVFVIMGGSGEKPDDNPGGGDGTRVIGAGSTGNGGSSSSGGGQKVNSDVVIRKKELDNTFDATKAAVDRAQGSQQLATLLNNARAVKNKIDAAWNDEKYQDAATLFNELEKSLDAVDKVLDERIKADRVRQEVRIAAMRADQAGAKIHVQKLWDEAEALRISANASFDGDRYGESVTTYEKARPIFEDAEKRAKTAKQAQQTKTDFEEQLVRNYPRSRFETEAGDTWTQVLNLLDEADKDYNNERYDEALAQYTQAIEMIPDLELAVRQLRGGKYFAFQAGYTAADVLLSRASGEQFTSDHRDVVIKAFRNAKIDGVFLRGVPDAPDTPYQDLSDALAIEARARLDSAAGTKIGASFGAGFQFRIIERLLRGFGPTLTVADKAEISKSLRALDSEARDAEWKDEIFDFTKVLGEKLKGSKDVPDYQSTKESREHFAKMMTKLSNYDTALEVMGVSNE